MKCHQVRTCLCISLIFIIAAGMVGLPSAHAVEPAAAVSKVAVLPFNMHTPSNLSYLQDGVRDMLTSRLSWQGRVQVIDRTLTTQALQGVKQEISLNEALKAGKALKADYVLFGSITSMGQAVSIDAKMAPVSGSSEPLSLYAQTKSLDEVVPKINQFAQEINLKVFARPSEQGSVSAAADSDSPSNRNPELLVPDTMVGTSDRISYLNPNFIEITSEASLRQPGLWRSQTFKGAVVGMDIGDLDGDGRLELVTISPTQVTVYRRENQGLKTIATFDGPSTDRYLWVSVADMNRDGKAKIFVTNLAKKNFTRAANISSVEGDRGYAEQLSSFVLSLDGTKLNVVCKAIPYFLNAMEIPGRGKVLIGQEKGALSIGPFLGGINEMQLVGGTLKPMIPVAVPSRCNVFNFALADINNDHSNEVVLIDGNNRLVVLSAGGDQLWRSDKLFAATTNMFEGRLSDRRYNDVDFFCIPSPVLVTDLNKDNIPEIIVNRSLDNIGKFLPNAIKFFDKGEIVSVTWDQMGMVENWKTREIGGMVTSIRVGDLNNDGIQELIVSLVLASDFMKLWESKSTIFSYDLNISTARGIQPAGTKAPR